MIDYVHHKIAGPSWGYFLYGFNRRGRCAQLNIENEMKYETAIHVAL